MILGGKALSDDFEANLEVCGEKVGPRKPRENSNVPGRCHPTPCPWRVSLPKEFPAVTGL